MVLPVRLLPYVGKKQGLLFSVVGEERLLFNALFLPFEQAVGRHDGAAVVPQRLKHATARRLFNACFKSSDQRAEMKGVLMNAFLQDEGRDNSFAYLSGFE